MACSSRILRSMKLTMAISPLSSTSSRLRRVGVDMQLLLRADAQSGDNGIVGGSARHCHVKPTAVLVKFFSGNLQVGRVWPISVPLLREGWPFSPSPLAGEGWGGE